MTLVGARAAYSAAQTVTWPVRSRRQISDPALWATGCVTGAAVAAAYCCAPAAWRLLAPKPTRLYSQTLRALRRDRYRHRGRRSPVCVLALTAAPRPAGISSVGSGRRSRSTGGCAS